MARGYWRKYTPQQMIEALHESKGMLSPAARKLGCTVDTIKRYVKEYASVREVLDEEAHKTGDNVEMTLLSEAMGQLSDDRQSYIREPNVTALMFLVATKWKDRGYTKQLDINIKYVEIIKRIEIVAAQLGVDPAEALNDYYAVLDSQSRTAGSGADAGKNRKR